MTYHYSPVKASDDGDHVTILDSNNTPNTITMHAGPAEMLKISSDGFYVRGVKVPADDKEAETVYNAFKAFLMWAELNRK